MICICGLKTTHGRQTATIWRLTQNSCPMMKRPKRCDKSFSGCSNHGQNQKALESAGWRFGDAADFLDMTNEERQLLDARFEAALAVRRQRERLKLSQKDLALRIKTSQPRIARIERAARDLSLDQIL